MSNIEILEEMIIARENHIKNYEKSGCETKLSLTLIEEKNAIENLIKENKELKKYDYRNIKLDEKNKISSIHFTKEQLDLMNLGIALYVGIPKILADEEDEETDI